jgi:hypothetical protein
MMPKLISLVSAWAAPVMNMAAANMASRLEIHLMLLLLLAK